MGEFAARLRQRIEDTEAALRSAVSARDVYAVQVEQGELDSLLRIAADHGVDTTIHAIAA
ncbi:hypothetical protein [Actinospica sp.]|jgi:hypothetical protein|uniref:hypothetical protein n=1 Tax=Actinospica sp. TaxID=1872142 RepID=UPI002CF5C7F3|nr:hypothetical protein [Actinospica sp.]HWG26874.1 hypothetical protein [Actinospica sp.]